jgi:polynucleotide 5'-hydroxyl-kinase GRC3/NOL9
LHSRAIKISFKDTLLIKGPATIRLQDGEAEALGIFLSYEEPIVVRRNKILPIEPVTKPAYITASFGPNGGVVQKQIKCGTKIWARAKDLITSTPLKVRRLMVVGASDSGKSTLTTYLLNLAVAKGIRVGVVDADIGQSDLAPPGCVGGAVIGKQLIDLRDVRGDVFEFVGSTSPMGIEEVVVGAVRRAVERLSVQQPDLLLINTDGYVDGEGVEYKVRLSESLSPDLILYISTEPRSRLKERLIDRFGEERVLTLEGAEGVEKSSSERAERRMSQFHRYLKHAKVTRRKMSECKIIFLDKEYSTNPEGKATVGKLEVCDTQDLTILSSERRLVIPRRVLEGMFVGLGNEVVEGFGCVLRCGEGGNLEVLTPLTAFQKIQLSLIRLNEKLRDERIFFRELKPIYGEPFNKEGLC